MPAEEYPFFDILEWKGQGTLLLNRDPSGQQRKINLTMVGEKTTSIWQESINPSGKDYYFIHSENARYVYFLDQLQPIEGKIQFSQVNIAGNVKSSTALLSAAVRKLGDYDFNLLKMIDVFTTDKALVFLMRYHEKKEKRFTDFLLTMTHHNFLIYATKLGDIPEAYLKEPDKYSFWSYAGNEGEDILFYSKDHKDKKNGFSILSFTPKAELKESRFITSASHGFDATSAGAFGATGRFYLNTTEVSNGQLHMINGKFHHCGIRTEGIKKVAELYTLVDAEWVKVKSAELTVTGQKTAIFSSVAMNEGIGISYAGLSVFLPISGDAAAVLNTGTRHTPNNPSSTQVKELNGRFAVSLTTGTLYFDTMQLNKVGPVNFEFRKK